MKVCLYSNENKYKKECSPKSSNAVILGKSTVQPNQNQSHTYITQPMPQNIYFCQHIHRGQSRSDSYKNAITLPDLIYNFKFENI